MAETETAARPSSPTPAWEAFPGLTRLPVLRPDFSAYKFQDFAIYRALLQRIFVIALSTGLGKTFSSYSAYLYYRLKQPKTKLIVLTNKSAVLQFAAELPKFFDVDFTARAIHSKMSRRGKVSSYGEARKRAYAEWAGDVEPSLGPTVDVLVMNYATFRSDLGEMKFKPDIRYHLKPGATRSLVSAEGGTIGAAVFKLREKGYHVFVIADEATAFKTPGNATSDAVRNLCAAADRVLGLTATLTKGKLEEIYGIFHALGVLFAPDRDTFDSLYCLVKQHPKKRYVRKIEGYKNTGEFVKLLAEVAIVLRKMDVAKFLPAYTLRKLPVEQSPEQIKLIADIYAGLIHGIGDEEAPAPPVTLPPSFNPFQPGHNGGPTLEAPKPRTQSVDRLTEVGFIKRALQDPRLVTKRDLRDFSEASASPKTREFLRLLTDEMTGEKIVFYTNSKMYLQLVRDTVRAAAGIPECYRNPLEISGDVDQLTRERNRLAFQDPESGSNLILLNDAGLESINLQAASVLVVSTMPVNGGNLVQLAGRLSRIGSTHANLLLLYIQSEDSQDIDEYLIIQQQLQMMAAIQGEAEAGLIDWEVLRDAAVRREREQDTPEAESSAGLTPEEFAARRVDQILFHGRTRRASEYEGKAISSAAAGLV